MKLNKEMENEMEGEMEREIDMEMAMKMKRQMFGRILHLEHKPIWALLSLVLLIMAMDRTSATAEGEPATTPEPVSKDSAAAKDLLQGYVEGRESDATPGCRAPDIRFTVVHPDSTTEQPMAKFETTQDSMDDDLTTSDADSPDTLHVGIHDRRPNDKQASHAINPYQVDMEEHHEEDLHIDDMAAIDGEEDAEGASDDPSKRRGNQNNRKMNKKRRSGSGRRRRVESENGESRGRNGRYKRQVIHHDPDASPDTDHWNGGKLAAEGDVYYVHIDDLMKSPQANRELRWKLHKLKKNSKANKTQCNENNKDACRKAGEKKYKKKALSMEAMKKEELKTEAKQHHRHRGDSHEDKAGHYQVKPNGRFRRSPEILNAATPNPIRPGNDKANHEEPEEMEEQKSVDLAEEQQMGLVNGTGENLQRVKRKSGKTTGALSRPKSGGDSSSKTTSRKDKGIYDEESGYSPTHPDEIESEEEEEEEEEIDIQQQFTEVSEIRFPGEIGPLGDRRLCKIRCVKGKWIGPLCATNEEDDNGNVKFQPLYKSCHVNRIPPHLLLSYRNISVNVGWDLPHGHSLQARCKDLGLYKLLGESRVLCSNGLWAPRMPFCVPTTLLTNFSDDSAPSIRIKVLNGSGAFEPSGVLAVLPQSTIYLDCIYPRVRGIPEWTWTSWYMQYPTGWSPAHEEKNIRYRLTIKDIQHSDSGTFTCTSPRGLTNSIPIVVATSTCPRLPEPVMPLTLRLEGNKLGHRAMYRCPAGFRTDGVANATCLASGSWSSPPPTCQAVTCPRLVLDDPHLSLVELNTSAWGRAVFKCQWGFKLTGPPGLDCEPTGMWSGPVPRCKAIQCSMPVAPLNGRIGGTNMNQRRLTVGALVTFSCNEGHSLVGEPSIICTETGVWSHEPPFCKSQCPYPGDPPNGLIAPLKFNYDSGDYLTVQCRPGFVQYSENGPPERPKCQPDGNWSGPVPKCRSYEEV